MKVFEKLHLMSIVCILFLTSLFFSNEGESSMKGWGYMAEFPYFYSSESQSWYYFSVSLNDLWAYNYKDSKWLN